MSAADFVQRWHRKANESEDFFDRFFSAWIALVIKARGHLSAQQFAEPDTDRLAIIQYFEERAEAVEAVLHGLPEQVAWLARRRGTGTGQPILDVQPYSPQHLRRTFDDLALVWSEQARRKPRWIANATAEVVNHIRNNMFHGVKAPDDAADRELLERINCILLRVCPPAPGPIADRIETTRRLVVAISSSARQSRSQWRGRLVVDVLPALNACADRIRQHLRGRLICKPETQAGSPTNAASGSGRGRRSCVRATVPVTLRTSHITL